ncbi:hypothetical protein DMC64_38880 [Amycolatopsis sp. WAC 04197]|uniref:caspase family protein n=1 Tax=Amycolatopsis sp. WAC 04197 TaxID=2203199 RepID=UPI000F76C7B4|nr:caspase family protein [Amycolatopsis sp. WAC 04197]RSN39107.1 hypothetical protein DMC64_38880 [Amycolatopsis sp. WAC 04197]
MPIDPEEPRRYLLAAAVAHYPKAPQWDRTELVEAREQIIRLFTDDLGYKHISSLGLDPHKDQLTAMLRDFCLDAARRPDDIVAVYIGGHGEVLDETHEHLLLTSETNPNDVAGALPTADLARAMLLRTRVRRVLLMLDTCYSGHGVAELTAAAITTMTRTWGDDHGAGLAVITSAQPTEQAGAGAFPRLLREAVRALPTAGYNPATLPLDSLVKLMNTSVAKPGYQTIGHSITGLTGEVPPFLPNPRHDPRMTEIDLALQHASEFEVQAERRDTELRTRLLVRAMGGTSNGTGGWWFTGRHTALLDITVWLHHPDAARPLQVVTGNPGSGKTAVLGLIAALTHPDRRATVPLGGLGLPAAAVPDMDAVDVAIYAQGLTSEEMLSGIAAAVQSNASTPGQLLEELDDRSTPLTVLIDALDEATDPDHLVRRLLRPLADHAAGRLRLLVGTRDFLLERLGFSREDTVDLDADRYADLAALTTYVGRGLLDTSAHSPYRNAPPSLLRAVADAVAEAAHPSFLVARITSATLAAHVRVADPNDPAWRRTLPRLPGEAMRHDLEVRLGDNAARVSDLLRPLAYAEGQGLPWEDIWAAVACRASGTSYTDEDLLWLRKHAGSYVVEAIEDGRSTYRLYHHALADHLREHADETAMHEAITEVLLSRVPRIFGGCRDWPRAHPYALRHLATHAALAGQIDNLVADAEYLVYAEPAALLLALHRTNTEPGVLAAAVYRCSIDSHRHLPPRRRRQVLATDAARFRVSRLHQELSASLEWRPRWTTGRHAAHIVHAIFTGHTNSIMAAACTTLGGRAVAVTVSEDNTARVWDLATSEEITTFTGHTDSLRAVACTTLGGRAVAVTVSEDNTARVWDLATSEEITTFTGHTDSLRAVACTTLDDRPVAVTTGRDKTARVWDLATAEEITTFTGHTSSVRAVSCSTIEGHPIAVTAGIDETSRVWRLFASVGDSPAALGHSARIAAGASTTVGGRSVAVTASNDKTARVWDLATAEEITTFTGHTNSLRAVACTTLAGRPVAVTASNDKTARVWDLATAEEITTFTGHTSSVRAVACATIEGRAIAVTAGTPVARAWDLATGEEITTFTGHTKSVEAVACATIEGRAVAVTASNDNTARVWDLATGEEITTFTGHTKSVEAVACATIEGRAVAVTASNDNTARVWDLATGEELNAFDFRDIGAVALSTGGALMITTGWDVLVFNRTARR